MKIKKPSEVFSFILPIGTQLRPQNSIQYNNALENKYKNLMIKFYIQNQWLINIVNQTKQGNEARERSRKHQINQNMAIWYLIRKRKSK